MKTQVAETSIKNYHDYPIKGKHEQDQLKSVVDCIRNHSKGLSGRQISRRTGIENSSVARTLHGLKKAQQEGFYPQIEVYKDRCSITGVLVQHYRFIKTDRDKQVSLF